MRALVPPQQQQQQWKQHQQQWRRHRPCCLRRARVVTTRASLTSPFRIRLLHPVKVADADSRPLLVFLPGTDGTGQAVTPQLPALLAAGYDVRSLYVPPDDRCGWEQLQAQTLYLLAQTLAARPPGRHNVQVTLLAESFGGCLALRLAAAAPHLFRQLVLLNPATCFSQSLGGLSAFVSATNLLGLFPQDAYNTAQAVLLPFLVDIDRVGPEGAAALRSMIFMEEPPDYETAASQQAGDDEEAAPNTVVPERRRLQTNSAASFSSSGPAGRRAASPGAQALLSSLGMRSRSSGGGRSGVFGPAAAANWRSNLLREANLDDAVLRRIATPTLLISSAKDRMLPSLAEGARLGRLLPAARRVILPDSGHAALLERGLDIAAIMRGSGVSISSSSGRAAPPPPPPAAAAAGQRRSSSKSSSSSSSVGQGRTAELLGVVRDEQALPAILGVSGAQQPPRPATVLPCGSGAPQSPAPAAAAAAAAAASSSRSSSSASNGSKGGSSSSPAPAAPSSSNDLAWDEWSQLLAPWRDLVSPVLLGQEHLQAVAWQGRPVLFVGPHGKMGLYDMPLLAYELYMRGFKPRGLAHPSHWAGPLGAFFEQFGAVPAGPMTAYKLLKANEHVLLFPGGAKEVNKRVGQENMLFWRDSPDFVRLAARCRAIIVPFAAVGADDAYDVMMEADELLEVPVLGGLVKAALQRFDPTLSPSEAALPLTRLPGLGVPSPVPLPNLTRLYFKVCPPVDTAQLGLDIKGDGPAWQALYDDIKATVIGGMDELLQVQAADEQRGVGARISKAIESWQPAFSLTSQTAGTAEEAAASEAARSGMSPAGGSREDASPP